MKTSKEPLLETVVTLRLPAELANQYKAQAKQHGESLSDFIRAAVAYRSMTMTFSRKR